VDVCFASKADFTIAARVSPLNAISGQADECGLSTSTVKPTMPTRGHCRGVSWLAAYAPSFETAVAERDSERTGLLSECTWGTLECSGDSFDGRFVS
jgi:hypothetical protein